MCREDILSRAYKLARANASAPGVDGTTFEQIDASRLEAWLAGLRDELVTKTYRPDPLRRVMIPKPGGGERPLGIPTIRDRVVQAAAKIVLEPIFEADFEDGAMGIARDVTRSMQSRKCTGLCAGATGTLLTPICRNTSTRSRIRTSLDRVARRIVDRNVLRLIKLWLQAPVEERDRNGKHRMSGGKSNRRGTPQGGVASPLLSVIYMNRFLKHWRLSGRREAFRDHVISYADDFVILSRGHAEEALTWTRAVMTKLGVETQRGENHGDERPMGKLRRPWVHTETPLPQWGTVVCWSGSVQEKCAADQQEGQRAADAGQQGRLARSASATEPPSGRLVRLLQLWLSRHSPSGR